MCQKEKYFVDFLNLEHLCLALAKEDFLWKHVKENSKTIYSNFWSKRCEMNEQNIE